MLLQLSQLSTHRAAPLDFELGVPLGYQSFQAHKGAFKTLTSENLTSEYKWNALYFNFFILCRKCV